jgi:peptidoglycan lytic transglycosylase G
MFKKLLIVLLLIVFIAGYFGYDKYRQIFASNVPAELKNEYLLIPSGSNFEELLEILKDEHFIIDETSFVWVAQRMKYIKPELRSGRYKIQPNWSNRSLINHLRNGKQATVKVVLNNERLPEEVAGKVSKTIESDSIEVIELLKNKSYLDQFGLNPETAMTVFIPNTYDFFWDTDAISFFEKMLSENEKFWKKKNRLKKAKKLNLSKEDVYTLASIVEKETNKNDEKQRMAGVYINRLKTGMPLQADPTVVFATRDFSTKRVLNRHTEYDSPYNTYMYKGLPPGPISMASISSIDGVLNAEDHDYVFFCAKGDGSGYHAFAKTLSGHNANARRYAQNLKKRGLR